MAATHVDRPGISTRDTDGTYARSVSTRAKAPGETRRSFKTTELWVMLASIAAEIVVGYIGNDSLNAARMWTLVTALAGAYMLSRGLAKAGSHEGGDYTR